MNNGKFAPAIVAMLEYRTALGLSGKTLSAQLNRFDRYCAEHYSECGTLSKEMVFGWLGEILETAPEGISGHASAIRQFAEYLNAIGQSAYVLPMGFYPYKSGFTAYIFTDAELSALFRAIDTLPHTQRGNEARVAPVLFRLIYTCGLRPNEGRELKRADVCFDSGEIKIVRTKKNKDRLVVMSPDMLKLCKTFDLSQPPGREYFFSRLDGKTFTATQIDSLIKKCWSSANPGVPNLPNVRTYDLRHRFASARLNQWLDEGANLGNKMMYLMAYMGHDYVDETAYYIHILPENLVKSAGIDWDSLNSLVPEVSVWRR